MTGEPPKKLLIDQLNTMDFFFFRHPEKHGKNEAVKNMPVATPGPLHNGWERSQIPGPAVRTDDLPIIRTEESIAAGSPENLL